MSTTIYALPMRSFTVHAGDVLHIEQDAEGRWLLMHVITVADVLAENAKLKQQIEAERTKPTTPVTVERPEAIIALRAAVNRYNTKVKQEPQEQFKFGRTWLPRSSFLQKVAHVLTLPYTQQLSAFCMQRPDQFYTLRALRMEAGQRIVTETKEQLSQCNYAWKRLAETGLLQHDPHHRRNALKHHEQHRLGMTKGYADTIAVMILDYMTAPST
jgi:hypothetical protein